MPVSVALRQSVFTVFRVAVNPPASNWQKYVPQGSRDAGTPETSYDTVYLPGFCLPLAKVVTTRPTGSSLRSCA